MDHAQFKYIGDERWRFLKRLFRAWHHQLRAFEDWMGDDVPYWYSERTNTGILAAAALRLKDTKIALEEYAVRRGGVKGNGAGRADLYLYDSRANRSYDFEFKFRGMSRSLLNLRTE